MKKIFSKTLLTLALICVIGTNIPYSDLDYIILHSDIYIDTESNK